MRTNRLPTLLAFAALAALLAGVPACEDKAPLAPPATELKASPAKIEGAAKLTIDAASSKVDFMMEAPKEKIRGRVNGAAGGDLQVDLADLTKTTGLITVDISGIELFQTVAGDDGKFGEEKKSDTQNEHARTWLEISPDTPAETREKNAKVQFAIRTIEAVSEPNVLKMTGAERKVTLKATGEFLLHQRKTEKTAELEVTFQFAGDKPASVSIKTVKPFAIGLAEHDVHPREAFGKLAAKTLDLLAPKVAKEALVSIELSAKAAAGSAMPAKDAPK
jgi:hypothetical protein